MPTARRKPPVTHSTIAARQASAVTRSEDDPLKPLNAKENLYVQARASGMPHSASLAAAGLSHSGQRTEKMMLARPAVAAALEAEQKKFQQQCKYKRDDVLNGLSEAIEQAKMQADPTAQIAGWREIAKICGFYAPETKKIELGGSARRLLARFESLSDDELLQIAEGDVIDGEFTDVTDRAQLR